MMVAVYIASPFRGNRERNIEYAKRCMLHSIEQGEAPYVPHLQLPLVLDDDSTNERARGMEIATTILFRMERVAVYADYGISDGMLEEINKAQGDKRIMVEIRKIGENPGNPQRRKTDGG